jgi:membrane dipeptidase
MTIVDAHLDLAYNAQCGRPVHLPARQQPADDQGIPTVGLPDLRAGHVDLICATLFCLPEHEGHAGYRTADEAHAEAIRQLDYYRDQQSAGTIQLISSPKQIATKPKTTQAILLMEGADPIRNETDAQLFFDAGVRIVGLAWKVGTRYAGGNAIIGPLTQDGIALVKTLDNLGIIHDVSHLAEEAFRGLLEATAGPIIASHSNCRAIVPGERQLSDEMIHAIVSRNGVIGINFFDVFLLPPDQPKRRAHLEDVIVHINHICDLAGSAAHVGLGTDMDGGFGGNEIPVEIHTSADLPRVADALSTHGFTDRDIEGIMSRNWTDFFGRNLAAGDVR